ncbi:MAG: AraC family transcriptional regulator [Phycisphaerae bacterium]
MQNKEPIYIQNLDMNEVDTIAYDYIGKYLRIYTLPRFDSVSRVNTKRPWRWKKHQHLNHEWIVINRGKVRCWIDEKEFIISAGEFYFVQPGQYHCEESIELPLDFYTISFDLIEAKNKHVYFAPPPFVPEKQIIKGFGRKLIPLFKRIFEEVQEQEHYCEEIVEAMILQMIWIVKQRLWKDYAVADDTNVSERDAAIVKKSQDYINQNLNRSISLGELADVCYVSRYHLGHVFTKAVGTSPLQYALGQRMEKAKNLLMQKMKCVYEVATELGFEDPYYFSRQFKKVVGVSPKVFQRDFKK